VSPDSIAPQKSLRIAVERFRNLSEVDDAITLMNSKDDAIGSPRSVIESVKDSFEKTNEPVENASSVPEAKSCNATEIDQNNLVVASAVTDSSRKLSCDSKIDVITSCQYPICNCNVGSKPGYGVVPSADNFRFAPDLRQPPPFLYTSQMIQEFQRARQVYQWREYAQRKIPERHYQKPELRRSFTEMRTSMIVGNSCENESKRMDSSLRRKDDRSKHGFHNGHSEGKTGRKIRRDERKYSGSSDSKRHLEEKKGRKRRYDIQIQVVKRRKH